MTNELSTIGAGAIAVRQGIESAASGIAAQAKAMVEARYVMAMQRQRNWEDGVVQDLPLPSLDIEGEVSWLPGEIPAGTAISLSGRRKPDYFCFGEYPQDRAFHHGADLPRRVVMRKFDLFGR